MKPIVPGCLAVCVGLLTEENGKCVRVGRFLGTFDGDPGAWEITPGLHMRIPGTGHLDKSRQIHHCPEVHLLRIDGFEEHEALEAIGVEHA